jgi:hypothetical protein
MNCRDLEKNSAAWLQGRRPELAESIAEHTGKCSRCALLLREEKALLESLAPLRAEPTAPDLWPDLHERIRTTTPHRAAARPWYAFALTAAVAAALAFVSLRPQEPVRDLTLAPEDEVRIVRMAADVLPAPDPADDAGYEGMRATRSARQAILIGYAGDGE